METIHLNQANTRVSYKTCKKQLEWFEKIRLDNSIALDSYIGQESKGFRGSKSDNMYSFEVK